MSVLTPQEREYILNKFAEIKKYTPNVDLALLVDASSELAEVATKEGVGFNPKFIAQNFVNFSRLHYHVYVLEKSWNQSDWSYVDTYYEFEPEKIVTPESLSLLFYGKAIAWIQTASKARGAIASWITVVNIAEEHQSINPYPKFYLRMNEVQPK